MTSHILTWAELKEIENDAKAEEKTLTNGLFNVLQDTVTVVSGNNFKRDENYWSPPKLYKTIIVEARRGEVHPEWSQGLWIRFRIYNFEHKGGSLIVPDKMLWSIVINYKSPTDQTPTPVDWKLALTVLSQRLEKIITRQ